MSIFCIPVICDLIDMYSYFTKMYINVIALFHVQLTIQVQVCMCLNIHIIYRLTLIWWLQL